MLRKTFALGFLTLLFPCVQFASAKPALDPLPPNLARQADVQVNSQHPHLPGANVADGRIAQAGAAMGEFGSWAIVGEETKGAGQITFTWNEPVELAEIVYFGRCAWQMQEVFKDYEVYVAGRDAPVAKGALEMKAGPQVIQFDPVSASELTIKFLTSHGGSNPGANEIMVFPEQLTAVQRERMVRFAPNSLISDHMVVQRGKPMCVWGAAVDGEEVTVEFRGHTERANAVDGRWLVKLPAVDAGGPDDLTITSEAGSFVVRDVLVGEVWVASGQSNMEMPVAPQYWPNRYDGVANHEAEVAAADYPQIRLFYVPRIAAGEPRDDTGGTWRVCNPETAGGFSAVSYFFARKLHEELGVPVGMIDCSWGATYIEPWTPQEGFDAVAELDEVATKAREEQAAYAAAVAANPANPPGTHQHQLSALYRGMVHRLTPLAIRGAIWYQGEGNVGNRMEYYHKMRALIGGWRQAWGEGDFPFLYVQLAPYDYGLYKGSKNNYHLPALWEAQTAALAIPNTGMAVTTDISEVANIHPPNKQDVGLRLALWALARTYGQKNVVCSGPLYQSHQVDGDHIRVQFDDAEGGLKSRDGEPLNWFTMAGADQVFHEATAEIDGDTVVVHSDKVAAPVAVRFGWHKLAEPNLAGATGLPAVSFRTDDWDVQIGLQEEE